MDITKKLLELASMKASVAITNSIISDLQAEIIRDIEKTTDSGTYENEWVEAKVIRPVRTNWDIDQLSEKLAEMPGNEWNKVSTRVLDSSKLDERVAGKHISIEEIRDCAVIKETSPYLKIKTL